MNGTYRRYFERGYLTTQGSIMRDQDDDETRGNLYVKSRYELNDYWVSDLDLNSCFGFFISERPLPAQKRRCLVNLKRQTAGI